MAQAVKAMRENLPALEDMHRLTSHLMRIRYDALLSEGFTPEQALFLCKI